MFIYNVKIGNSKLYKLVFFVLVVLMIILCGIIGNKLYKASVKVNDDIKENKFIEPTNDNYATILKTIHNDIDTYVGQKIKYSGFVYRVYDLNNEQFVLARNMIISPDDQTVIVGFLSHYKKANELKDYTWVEIEATITKGKYHGDMPILEINKIKEIEKPNDEFVCIPDKDYIPTSVII